MDGRVGTLAMRERAAEVGATLTAGPAANGGRVRALPAAGAARHDATREIVAAPPGTAVLVLTMFEDDDMVFSAVSAGAAGYLLKGAEGTGIVTAVRAAGAGQAVFGAALAQRLRTWFTRGPQPSTEPFPQLTVREREILDGVAAALTNAQIGQQMFLAAKTVGRRPDLVDSGRGMDNASGGWESERSWTPVFICR